MHKLAAKASDLSRRIYASLPWGFRVAGLLIRLSNTAQEAFGRYVYSVFIRSGVVGLPDVNGEPALSLQDKMKGPTAPNRLPRGYGSKFAQKVWAVALSKLRNPEIVEEAISRVTLTIASGKFHVEEGADLARAEAFVVTSVLNAGRDLLRSNRRQNLREDHGSPGEDEDGGSVEISDPSSFQKLDDVLGPSDLNRLLAEVSSVHPRASEWVQAQLDGMPKKDLAEKWGVSPNMITNFENRYLDKIKIVVHRYIDR